MDPVNPFVREDGTSQSSEEINERLSRLDEREQKIIRMRFGLEGSGEIRSLEDVAAEMNLTRERTRQIEARAMSKLRHTDDGDTGARDLLTL